MSELEAVPLAGPSIGAREEELVLEVLRSGRLSLGPVLDRFESRFAAFAGAREAVAVSSGTAALHLGVRELGWGEGDEVITSPFSFVASANCLLYERAVPRFVDIDPVTLNLDPEAAAAAVGDATVGVLPVHIFGYPAAMPELEALASRHALGVLEDACEAPGATDSEGRSVGGRGNLAAFGFYANKQLTTGEGGMIVCSGPDQAARLRSERNQGRALDMGWLDHDRLGFNYRLTDIQAAIGIAQVERAEELLLARERVAGLLGDGLTALGGSPAGEGDPDGLVLPCSDRGAERRSWFVYTVRLPAGTDRDAVIADLAQRGIASKAYLPCIHLMPFYRERFGFGEGDFPIAEEVASRSLALPFFPGMAAEQVDRVVEAVAEALRGDWG
ncbi:DegT/DnrJ/EryC1/StrS family aminotransferase [Thermoleophilia bacterium SCSIO 60948]|nr:DegT/DnrJ/EryC1/StrS family aminotransferase [Thermoleophilia bacterium SCSIO 60948]